MLVLLCFNRLKYIHFYIFCSVLYAHYSVTEGELLMCRLSAMPQRWRNDHAAARVSSSSFRPTFARVASATPTVRSKAGRVHS